MFALIGDGMAAATQALLQGDQEVARTLIRRDRTIDEIYRQVETMVEGAMTLQSPMAADLRYLLTVLRIVPELERSGDLVEHIALRGMQNLHQDLSPRLRGIFDSMGHLGADMWRRSADAWADRNGTAWSEIDDLDDEMDTLHASLTAEAAAGGMSVPVAIEVALLGRFYERLGDHAVNVAERVRYLAGHVDPLQVEAPHHGPKGEKPATGDFGPPT